MTNSVSARRRVGARAVTVTAMFSAVAFVLMFLEFSLPIIPSFVKMDVSELPALLAAFGLGPVYGVVVCLVKTYSICSLPPPVARGNCAISCWAPALCFRRA